MTASREAVGILHSNLAVAVDDGHDADVGGGGDGLPIQAQDQQEETAGAVGAGRGRGNRQLSPTQEEAEEGRVAEDETSISSGSDYDSHWRDERVRAVRRLKEVGVGAWCGAELDASVVRALTPAATAQGTSSGGAVAGAAASLGGGRQAAAQVIGAPPASYCAKVVRSRERSSMAKVARLEPRSDSEW